MQDNKTVTVIAVSLVSVWLFGACETICQYHIDDGDLLFGCGFAYRRLERATPVQEKLIKTGKRVT